MERPETNGGHAGGARRRMGAPAALLAAALLAGCAGTRAGGGSAEPSPLEAPVARIVDDLLHLAERRADTSAMRVQVAELVPLGEPQAAERELAGLGAWPAARPEDGGQRAARELRRELTLQLSRRLHLIEAPLAVPAGEEGGGWVASGALGHGATHVLLGELERRAAALRLSLRLVDAHTGVIVAAARGPIPAESLPAGPARAPRVAAAAPALAGSPPGGGGGAGDSAPPGAEGTLASGEGGLAGGSPGATRPPRDPETGLLLPPYVPEPSSALVWEDPLPQGGTTSAEALEALARRPAAGRRGSEGPAPAVQPPTQGSEDAAPAASDPVGPTSTSPAVRAGRRPGEEPPDWVRDVVRRYGAGGDRYGELQELEGRDPDAAAGDESRDPGSAPPRIPSGARSKTPPPPSTTPAPSSTAPARSPRGEEVPPWIPELVERYRAGGPRSGAGGGSGPE